MNEIQIIQGQLAAERLHFAEVAAACGGALDAALWSAGSEFTHACADYFAFASARFESASTSAAKLASARAADPAANDSSWRDFLKVFTGESQQHFAALDARLTRSAPVTQWRARSGIDADSIYAERALYERVKTTLPAGIKLAARSAFLP
jgi:hypothetical protein